MTAWTFKTDDKDILKKIISRERGELHRHLEQFIPEQTINGLSIFLVVLDDDLPAATYNQGANQVITGMTTGTLWRRDTQATEESSQLQTNPTTNQLIPQREDDNSCVRVRIFNDKGLGYPACTLVKAVQDNWGDLYVIGSASESLTLTSGSPAVSTSSTTSTTTTHNPFNPCTGSCIWLWNGSYWNLQSSSCFGITTTTSTSTTSTTTTGTTTTSTTTTAGSTTTTLDPCVCQSTTSTSTTSVPFGACSCAYPVFCGKTIGDCTRTSCIPGNQTPNSLPPCTSTSSTSTTSTPTTTCDCHTSTTTPIPPGCTGCHYAANADGITFLITNDCYNCGGCASFPNLAACTAQDIDCIGPTTTVPPPPSFCGGFCCWWCQYGGSPWEEGPHSVGDNGLAGPTLCGCNASADCVDHCTCDAPSFPCAACGSVAITPCFTFDAKCLESSSSGSGNGGGGGPCPNCTSTTTGTTTTSTTPICKDCQWKWNGSAWTLYYSNCGAACVCRQPSYNGTGMCEVAYTLCNTTTSSSTTTTTTSTTTSSTTTGTTTTTTSTSTTTTTSTSTTSTTTTTANCGSPCECDWVWNGSSWEAASSCFRSDNGNPCDNSCFCNYPLDASCGVPIGTHVFSACQGYACGTCSWVYSASDNTWKALFVNCTGACDCLGPPDPSPPPSDGCVVITSCA